jgi:phosphate starvation-inducible PhoH-like protein
MLDPEEMQRHVDRGVIEVAPLAYMRGRTLNRAFIVLDEAQNTTTEQMFMFLTRLGMESKCIITGDQTQIDLPNNKRSGLIEAMQALKATEGIAFQYFEERDVVRHPLVQAIVRAYKQYRGVKGSGAERP